jgi:hypothetical protein
MGIDIWGAISKPTSMLFAVCGHVYKNLCN